MSALRQLFAGELPRLVMFDLDGTLLDSVPDLAAAIDRMLLQLGRAPAGVGTKRLRPVSRPGGALQGLEAIGPAPDVKNPPRGRVGVVGRREVRPSRAR